MKCRITYAYLLMTMLCILGTSCGKDIKDLIHGIPDKDHGHLKQTKNYSADVAKRWLGVQTAM